MPRTILPVGKYRLTLKSYVAPAPGQMAALMEAGAEILYDGVPGEHMEPLDAQAQENANPPPKPKAAPSAVPRAATTKQADPESGTVEIPEDWRERTWPFRKSLASKLTSDPVMSGADAEAAILAEIERRKG